MENVYYIAPKNAGNIAAFMRQHPHHKARCNTKRGIIVLFPKPAANQEFPRAA